VEERDVGREMNDVGLGQGEVSSTPSCLRMRAATSCVVTKQDVDGRVKPRHDEWKAVLYSPVAHAVKKRQVETR
jgi:hypothetical protein